MGICLQQRAIKYRIYPTPEQEVLIQKTFGCCRFVWNHMLGDEQRFYEETDIHYIVTPAKYKKSFPFLNEVDSLALCNEQVNLQNAFAAFLGKHAAHPRFKIKKKSKKSYTTNIQRKAASIIANAIFLPKLKWVRAKIHRMPRTGWRLKNATVSQTASGKYFCSLCFEFNAVEPTLVAINESKAIGLDYSSPCFYVDDKGCTPDVPRWFRKSEEKLSKLQRQLSRMKDGSKNYAEQQHRIFELQEHIANQRQDFAHKESRRIANAYDIVCMEDVDLKVIAQSLKLGKSTMDNGYGRFRTYLGYKLAEKGKRLVYVDKWFASTKTCNHCGTKNPAVTLSVQEWTCPCCSTVNLRDENAAKNIKDEGLRILYGCNVPYTIA